MSTVLTALAMAAGAHASGQAPAPPPPVIGTWHNPRNSVAVKTGACPDAAGAGAGAGGAIVSTSAGGKLCGWIIRASEQAQVDARNGGTPRLIGTALLRQYRPSGRNKWAGQVYVPDMGRTFGSTITLVDTDTIDVKGCLVGGFFCKTQTWRRD